MIELIDIDGNIKFMASIISGVKYGDILYVIYSIKRDESEDNIFVSKLANSSDGYVMDNKFNGGEKEVFDDIIKAFLNKDDLSNMKVELIRDINLCKINKFSVTKCYVSTCKRNLIRDCIKYYNLNNINDNVVVKERSVKYLSKNSLSNIIFIVMGIVVIILVIAVIINYFIK